MDWYGLKENGVIVRVVNWTDREGEPTPLDFDYTLIESASVFYDVVPVAIEEL